MSTIFSLSALTAFFVIIFCAAEYDWRKLRVSPLVILLALGFAARVAAVRINPGYANDFNTFKAWANMLFEDGLANFYLSDSFTDYPPGYMYILYILGAAQSRLGLEGALFDFLMKLPAILCDLAAVALLYRMALRKCKPASAFWIGLAYALNPGVIMDASVWGQVDAVHTFLLLFAVDRLADKKYAASFMTYGLAILVKPQTLMIAPVFLYALYSAVFFTEKSNRRAVILKLGGCLAGTLALMTALTIPFTQHWNFKPILSQYVKTLASYPYATVNAYNLYAFLGANWKPVSDPFLGFSYNIWGYLFINAIVLFSLFILHRSRDQKSGLFFTAGLLTALTFTLSVKMHERYLFPALIFFLAAYIHKPDRRFVAFYGCYSMLFLVNCADVLYMLQNGNRLELIKESMPFVSMLNIILTGALAVAAVQAYKPGLPDRPGDRPELTDQTPWYEKHGPVVPEPSRPALKIGRKDIGIILAMMAVYAAIAFVRLGDRHAPQTAWAPEKGQSAVLRLEGSDDRPNDRRAVELIYMLGARHDKNFNLSISDDGTDWRSLKDFKGEKVFFWKDEKVDFDAPYVKITSLDDNLMIHELAFRDAEGNIIPAAPVPQDYPIAPESEDPLISSHPAFLCDEPQWVPETSSFMNSTYFDEIYHARTAYEFIHHLPVYEWTHPPLGKVIISWGVQLFGMTPFGWRFMGTLTGVLMIPVMYVLAKKLFGKREWAFFSAAVFTLDFMHFAQTRISTIDVYVTFFIMCMYLWMAMYFSLNFYAAASRRHGAFARSLVYLLFCGIFMGFAVSAKWQGAYAAAGLPILFFYVLYKRGKEYAYAKRHYADHDDQVEWESVRYFPAYAAVTLAACLVFFIVIPALIYRASYGMYLQTPDQRGLASVFKNQRDMFHYHATLVSTHSFASYWFQWPFMTRPIYYSAGTLPNGLRTGISSFGNPAVWWGGIAALFYCVRAQSKKFDKILLFLFVAYAAQYLPWALVSRTTYIYHYFPSVPFVTLLIAYAFRDRFPGGQRRAARRYLIAAAALFVMFYPVISGLPIPMNYVELFLKWMPSWVLS
ncbi:MAG: phospholipid carrier-dependent glycosyltransferase [Clostridiales bacterium]|nr:phospholipid carrier-dependent glycosyltransferase [Clostridiales bacterium]